MRPGRKVTEKWERFTDVVREYIQTHDGIASICEVFEAGRAVNPRLAWTTPKLEEIARVLVKDNEFFRIDLTIPGGKPLAIYPGHHKLTSTTFFVPNTPDLDHSQSVERAKAILDDLIAKATSSAKKKTRRKPKDEDLPEPKPVVYTPNQFRSKECLAHGYIPMRSVQYQMFHMFLMSTYGGRVFTIADVERDITVDLAIKLVGAVSVPPVFLIEPKLLSITVGCLPPATVTEMFGENTLSKTLEKFIFYAAHVGYRKHVHGFLSGTPQGGFRVEPFVVCELEGQFTKLFDCRVLERITAFHRLEKLLSLMEFIDPHTNHLWMKRYGMSLNFRNSPSSVAKAFVQALVKPPYDVSWPYFHYEAEDLVAKSCVNWANLQTVLLQIYTKNTKEVDAKPKSTTTRVAAFLSGKEEFEPNPDSLFDQKTVEDFQFLAGLDVVTVFNNLAAAVVVMANGITTKLPRPWSTVRQYLEKLSKNSVADWQKGMVISTIHGQYLTMYKDYKDLYEYNVACNSREQMARTSFESILLTTSEFNYLMNISSKRLHVPVVMGELIERLKIVLLCQSKDFVESSARVFLSEIRNSDLDEAVFFLKMTRFLTQKISKDEADRTSRYRCTAKALQEVALARPLTFYSSLFDYYVIAKDPTKRGRMDSSPSACNFFLDMDADMYIELDLPEAVPVEIVQSTKRIERQSMTDISRKQRYGMPKGANIVVNSHRIGLPNLPPCEPSFEVPANCLRAFPSCSFRDYPACTCTALHNAFMQLFVIIFQTHPQDELSQTTLVSRLVYGFILDYGSEGVSLPEILSEYPEYSPAVVVRCIILLEEFEFIYRIHSMNIFPAFVADAYARPHLIPHDLSTDDETAYELVRPHFWVALDGNIDEALLLRIKLKISHIIELSPGIEIMELAAMMSNLSLADLLQIVDVLELDEVIYTVYSRPSCESLDDPEVDGISAPIDSFTFMTMVGNKQLFREKNRYERKLFPTKNGQKNLALAVHRELACEM